MPAMASTSLVIVSLVSLTSLVTALSGGGPQLPYSGWRPTPSAFMSRNARPTVYNSLYAVPEVAVQKDSVSAATGGEEFSPDEVKASSPQATHSDMLSRERLKDTMACDSTGRFCWGSDKTVSGQMQELYGSIKARDPDQPEFLQAFQEVLFTLSPVFEKNPKYLSIMKTIVEPERTVTFRVPWLDDKGTQHVNRGFRVQFSSALGPYKGGLRFHPSVNLSVVKFLGFEQIFKNALTGLPLGGGKGGSDFNPAGRSDIEVLRFCQSFMTSLARHIGADQDVPAGDIGVGGREIGYLYGQYKRITSQFEGCLTGKNPKWGGSEIRPEATGYGVAYFAEEMLNESDDSLKGKTACISGSGNVAQHCGHRLHRMGAKVLTFSDSGGVVYEPNGFTLENIEKLMELKNVDKARISEYIKISPTAKYFANEKPWTAIKCDVAFPCGSQNDITLSEAQTMVKNGCQAVVEGANMPSTNEAVSYFKSKGIKFAPAKAANAGGVAVSGLEMSQNSMRTYWSAREVDDKLKAIMKSIFQTCTECANEHGLKGDYHAGANMASFLKVADSVSEQGCV
eukprot:GHVN01020707.1.p1 GENE.GHVN01020707.1~~GHVN01020707.1.p1  ORF type:complete len:567 (+),score=79.62 GHVN01020707.1:167-1867(+)